MVTDDTQCQQDAEGDCGHADPGRQPRHLIQGSVWPSGLPRPARTKERPTSRGAYVADGDIKAGYAQYTGDQTLVCPLQQDFGAGSGGKIAVQPEQPDRGIDDGADNGDREDNLTRVYGPDLVGNHKDGEEGDCCQE